MSNRASVVAVFALLLMAVPAPAQLLPPWGGELTNPCLPFDPENTIEWPSGNQYGDPTNFGRVVLAELNGDQAPDAVVLAGGVPVVLWKVSVYDVPQAVTFFGAANPVAVTDIAVIPGIGPNGTDALAMSDTRGVFIVTHTGGGQFAFTVPEPTWTNAFKLHAEDVDNDGDLDVLGVASTKRSILKCLWNGTEFVPQTPITLQLDILDVTMVNWDGSLPVEPIGVVRELVALCKRALVVFLPGGGEYTIPYLSSTGCIARFRAADVEGQELLAWTRRITPTSGNSELLVLSQNVLEGPWELNIDVCNGDLVPLQPTALLAGNYDGNPNDELVIVHEFNHTAVVLANLSGNDPSEQVPEHFDPSNPEYFDIVRLAQNFVPASDLGIPAFADADNEEPDDLVFAVSTTEKVEVFTSLPYHRTNIVGGFYNSAQIVRQETEYGPGSNGLGGTLRFAMNVPPRYSAFTHVDVTIWRQANQNATTSDQYAVYNARHALQHDSEGGAYEKQWISLGALYDGEPDFPPYFPDGECWNDATPQHIKPYFYTEFRFARPAADSLSRIFAGGFTLVTCGQETNTSFAYLTAEGIPNSLFNLYEHHGLTGGALPGDLLGAYVPMEGVPHMHGNPQAGTQNPQGPTSFVFE